jgi:integrase
MPNKSDMIHGMQNQLQKRCKNILESNDISQADKDFAISENGCWKDNLEKKSLSKQRDYLQKFKQMAEYHNFNLSELIESEENVKDVIKAINRSAYAVRVDSYAPDTKKMFKQTLKRLLEYQGEESPRFKHPEEAKQELLPYDFTANVKESDKERTPPKDLPTPTDVKELAQKMEAVSKPNTAARNIAVLMMVWDAGCRIGEALSTDMEHVTVRSDRVEIMVQGNKKSDNRKATVKIASPALKHYIENVHPSPEKDSSPLFVNLSDQKSGGKRLMANNYTNVVNRAKKASNIEKDWSNEKNHIFRKARITYLKKAEKMDEANIDIRVGHVVGSDQTREYTRIGDEEADASYLEAYGLETSESNVEPDLEPLKCTSCSEVNSGHRDSCRSCKSVLDEKAYPVDVEHGLRTDAPTKEEAMQKVEQFGKEIEELKKDISDK